MAIIFSRVDGRMIHGQIAIAWTRLLSVDEIIVISDQAAKDETQRMLLEMAVPAGVDLTIAGVEETAKIIAEGNLTGSNTMLIYKNLHDVVLLAQRGYQPPSLNLGGLYHAEGKTQYAKALNLDEQDLVDLRYLAGIGVELVYQVAPMNNKEPLQNLVNL